MHVPPHDPIKIMSLRLDNIGRRTRHLSATYFAEWVLGTHRENASMQVVCKRDAVSGAVVAKNLWTDDFAGKLAFVATSPVADSRPLPTVRSFSANTGPSSTLGLKRH